MFSTVDTPANRILRIYLVTPEGEALALFGTLSIQKARFSAMPDTRTLEQIARESAATKWAIFSFQQSLDGLSSLPEDLRSYLARSPEMKQRIEVLLRERALAKAGVEGNSVDSLAQTMPDSIITDSISDGYPRWLAFAQSGAATSDSSGISQVRVEMWALRYDQEAQRAAPELLNSVTLDIE